MATLQENRVNFNSKLQINHKGGNLSTDSGLILIKEFMESIQFSKHADELLTFCDNRKYRTHKNISILEQLIFQLTAGYAADSSSNSLKNDPVLQLILEKESTASQPSISRFWDRITNETIDQFQELNQVLLDKVHKLRNTTEMIIDLDSTHSDTFGNQENSDYNGHYRTTGYHPLVGFDGLTGDFLKAELRPGNVYTSTGVKEFLQPLLQHYSESIPSPDILVRADSGFATPDTFESCEVHHAFYVVRLKVNAVLSRTAEKFVQIEDNHDWHEKEVHYYDVVYQAKSWGTQRRVCIKSTREANELLFRHEFIVTNLSENISAQTVYKTYQKRGTMENFIKESKNGFSFDKTDSSTFLENHARMMVSLLAYNVVNFMKTLCLPEKENQTQVGTLRMRFFKVAGKVVKTGRKLFLQLSSAHVYQESFYYLLQKIQQLSW